jgi:Mg2+-importing ATPase
MVVFGLVSSAFDLLTFGVLYLAFAAPAELFRGGWFLESTATELAVMLLLRTRRPFFRSRPAPALLASSALVALLALALPYTALAGPLGFVPLPGPVLLALGAITGGYVLATEVAKARFYRRRVVSV